MQERGPGVGQTEEVVGVRNGEMGGREREATSTKQRQGGPHRPACVRNTSISMAEKNHGAKTAQRKAVEGAQASFCHWGGMS